MAGGSYTSEEGLWTNVPLRAADSGQDVVAVIAPQGQEDIVSSRNNGCQAGSWLPWNLAEGHAPHHSLD